MTRLPFDFNAADWQMADDMYRASPDGQAEQARVQAWMDSLPKGSIEIRGFVDVPDEDQP